MGPDPAPPGCFLVRPLPTSNLFMSRASFQPLVEKLVDQVLLVEDDPVLQRAIVRAAKGVADVVVAATGREGLACAEAGLHPSVVLLDFVLPDIDGIQVLRALRARPDLNDVPVVLFSSLRDAAVRRQALAAGATDWVDKPDDPSALQDIVRKLCAKYSHRPADTF